MLIFLITLVTTSVHAYIKIGAGAIVKNFGSLYKEL